MPEVYISIGSNVDREHNIRSVVRALKSRFPGCRFSPVYRTHPVGFEGDDFYNLAAAFSTDMSPGELLSVLHEIEDAHGRTRSGDRMSSRTLDIDLLLYGDLVSESHRLPRDEILEYAFVLRPVAELAPTLIHPQTGRSLAEHWQEYSGQEELVAVTLDT